MRKSSLPILTAVTAGIIAVAFLQFSPVTDFLSWTTRPLVTWILQGIGVPAWNEPGVLRVGRSLMVPWSRDCAGVNSLALLLVFLLWSWRGRVNGRGRRLKARLA